MTGTMKCIVKAAAGPGNLELQTKAIPTPKAGEVLAKVHLAAICGTDIHIKNWAPFAQQRMNPPSIIGHEFVGEVVEVGQGVDPSMIGKLISAETHGACHKCAMCLDGKPHLCLNTRAFGVHYDGCFAEYVAVPAENAMICNPNVAEQNNAILEPLGTVVQAATKVAAAGKNVAITGCGPMGLMAVAVLKKMGARKVLCAEVNAYRAEAAMKMGADRVLNPMECDIIAEMRKECADVGPDIVIECSGSAAAIQAATSYVCPGGEMVQVALPSREIPIDFTNVFYRGINMYGVSGREMYHTWKVMFGMLDAGLDCSGCISHVLPMEEFEKGFDLMESGKGLKVLLRP